MINLSEYLDAIFELKAGEHVLFEGIEYSFEVIGCKVCFTRCDKEWLETRKPDMSGYEYSETHRHIRLPDEDCSIGWAVASRSEFYAAIVAGKAMGNS